MRRRLLIFCFFLSVLLCVATAIVWADSYVATRNLNWGSKVPGVRWESRSQQGALLIRRTRWYFMTPPNTLTFGHIKGHALFPGLEFQQSTGLLRDRLPGESASMGPFRTDLPTRPIYSSVLIRVFYWIPFVLFATSTAALLLKLRKLTRLARAAARAASGLCPTCSYDLTANTTGICPECGTRIPQVPQSIAIRS